MKRHVMKSLIAVCQPSHRSRKGGKLKTSHTKVTLHYRGSEYQRCLTNALHIKACSQQNASLGSLRRNGTTEHQKLKDQQKMDYNYRYNVISVVFSGKTQLTVRNNSHQI